MPTYSFINKETKEVTEHICKMSELDLFKENNPQLERHFTSSTPLVDPIHCGRVKIDNGFREVLQNIHRNTAGSVLGGNIR